MTRDKSHRPKDEGLSSKEATTCSFCSGPHSMRACKVLKERLKEMEKEPVNETYKLRGE